MVSSVGVVIFFYKTRQEDIVLSHDHVANEPSLQPATYLIPEKHSGDRHYCTMLKEYRKNFAVVAVARKYDFVKSILDAFSIELTFHDKTSQKIHVKSYDVHRDAGELLTYYILVYYLSEVILNNM